MIAAGASDAAATADTRLAELADVAEPYAEVTRVTNETRDMARLTGVMAAVVFLFAVTSVVVVLQTGDRASAMSGVTQVAIVALLLYSRRQLVGGYAQRGVAVLIGTTLVACLAIATIPPPVPALAAGPILAVAFALSFLAGRRLKVALVAAWAVSTAIAVIVEFTPASPELPPEVAAFWRITTFAAIVGLVGVILFRHRRRLEQALTSAHTAGESLRDSEARYRTVVEGVREVIFRVDRERRWSFLNRAWEELTGHWVADSIGRDAIDFIHPDDRYQHAVLTRRVIAGEVDEYLHELRLVGEQGSDIWVEVRGRPIHDDEGIFSGLSGTMTDITARRELEERLVQQAFHDDLTGLANRALFKDRVEHALKRRSFGRRLVALLFLDLDRFKTVNDSLGHTVGDDLLVAIAARLQAVSRPADTIARLGGDEFALLIDDVSTPQAAPRLAERISSAFDAPFTIGKREITIRCSIGVVVASDGHRSADDLLRDADVAMYQAKVNGRGSYAMFEPSMQAVVAARLELESDLREAIAHQRLSIAYQPIVDVRTGAIVAIEALARWLHPERGNVPPAVFIPSAEESGLIVPLGRWVLRRACFDLAELRKSGGAASDLRLSVNLSPRQLGDRQIVEDILGTLREAGLPADALQLEITESLVLDGGPKGIGYLNELRTAGCHVSFDDFGTGFSSLGNLRSLPIDELKIDRSFVASLLNGGVDAVVVEAVIRLGEALGVAVVAEGVEDAATAARLQQLGCPLAQGYYFARPEPLAALAARLSDQVAPIAFA